MRRGGICFCILLGLFITPLYAVAQGSGISIGYTTDGGGTQYTEDHAPSLADFKSDPTHAIYVALGLPIHLDDWGVLRLSGSVTFPAIKKIEQTTPTPPGFHMRDWDGETIWGTAEGLWLYPLGYGFSGAVGGRWDSWQTSMTNPRNYSFGLYAATDTADLTVNAYLPLLGIVSSWNGFSFGVLGFPGAYGDVTTHETRGPTTRITETGAYSGGHFVEIFTDWSVPAFSIVPGQVDGGASLFIKFNSLRASGVVTYSGSGGVGSRDTPFAFQRNLLSTGIQAFITFSLPDLGDIL
jgi:hypothetical protein